jgi:hypothetical protein
LRMNVKQVAHQFGFLSDGRLPTKPHERRSHAREGRRAEPAAGLVRDELEHPAERVLLGMAAVQEVAPELLGGVARWGGPAHNAATLARPEGDVKAREN